MSGKVSLIREDIDLLLAGRMKSCSQHVLAITIANPAATQTDTVTIDGTACAFTSDATPTKQEVSNGLKAAIALAKGDKVIVVQGAAPDYDLTLTPASWEADPTVTVSANLTKTTTDIEVPVGYARRQWVLTTALPTGAAWDTSRFGSLQAQVVSGTWGGATARIVGEQNGAYLPLRDLFSAAAASYTANPSYLIPLGEDPPHTVRPELSVVGVGAVVEVVLQGLRV